MSVTNIVRAVVKPGSDYTVTSPIMKEDKGQVLLIEGLDLPEVYEIDFSNDRHHGSSITMIGNADGVLIPTQFIKTGRDVFAFYYYVGNGFGHTEHIFRLPNDYRPDRTDEIPDPEEESKIDQAIAAVNEAVDTAEGYANAAADSAGEAARKAGEIEELTAAAQTLAPGSQATATYQNGILTIGVPRGDKGDKGDTGAQGIQGPKGERGEQGIQGIKGDKGDTGEKGDKGDKGDTGEQGIQGIQGERGLTGATGATGATPNLTIGTVETLDPTDDATATITGTPENPVLNLGIPQGEQGEVTLEEFYKAFPTDTASGSIASFTDGADDLPLKSLVVSIEPKQDGTGDPSPDNVRPISGWTGMEIQHNSGYYALFGVTTGKTLNASGEVISESGMGVSDWMPVKTGDVVTLKYTSTSSGRTRRIVGYDANKIFVGVLNSVSWANVGQEYTQTATINDGVKYVRACFFVNDTDKSFLNESSVSVIPISWQTEAGTVYGGSLDVLSGVMRVDVEYGQVTAKYLSSRDSGYIGYNSSVTALGGSPAVWVRNMRSRAKDRKSGGIKSWCNAFKIRMNDSNISSSQNRCAFAVDGTTINSVATFISAVETLEQNGGGLFVAYELKNPVEIQLDAHTINSLYGNNNIFADTGDSEVEYRADTKLYIERLTAPDSADMIADANIVSGQYFMVGNTLYKATANIANGGQITVGTNCTRVSLAQALNEINA